MDSDLLDFQHGFLHLYQRQWHEDAYSNEHYEESGNEEVPFAGRLGDSLLTARAYLVDCVSVNALTKG